MADTTGQDATVTNIAPGTMRVQTDELDDAETIQVADALQDGYGVSADQVSSTFVGPVWGEHVSQQMMIGLVVFLVLVALYMAAYFRTWTMSVAALTGLGFVVVTTVGIYSATGFEVTPSAVIGFLTILSYALYDTMVVFDKIRENLTPLHDQKDQTFTERTNLAINQTLVRSVNTSVVGLLPVGSILFIGAWLLGREPFRTSRWRSSPASSWAPSRRSSSRLRCTPASAGETRAFASIPRWSCRCAMSEWRRGHPHHHSIRHSAGRRRAAGFLPASARDRDRDGRPRRGRGRSARLGVAVRRRRPGR